MSDVPIVRRGRYGVITLATTKFYLFVALEKFVAACVMQVFATLVVQTSAILTNRFAGAVWLMQQALSITCTGIDISGSKKKAVDR